MFDDKSHRYAPEAMISLQVMKDLPVARWEVYPVGQHPKGTPLVENCCAVKCTLANGEVRWIGCDRAYINAELRMVVVGINSKDEVRRNWKKVPVKLCVG